MATGFWCRHSQSEGTIGAEARIDYLTSENKRLYEKVRELEKKLLTKKLFEIKPRMSNIFKVEGYSHETYADNIAILDKAGNQIARCTCYEWFKVTEIKE